MGNEIESRTSCAQLATDGKFEQPAGCRECGSKNLIPSHTHTHTHSRTITHTHTHVHTHSLSLSLTHTQLATDGKFEQPAGCRECGSKNLIPDRSAALTTDWQKIRVQVRSLEEMASFLEPFVGHFSPKVDKIFQN